MALETRVLRTESDYDCVLAEIEALMDADPGSAEEERLEVLAILTSDYERRHHPIPPPDPIDYLVHVMEARGLTRGDLEPFLGSRGRVTEVLNRKRPLTLRMVRRLSEGLGLDPAVLIRPYEVADRDRGKSPRNAAHAELAAV